MRGAPASTSGSERVHQGRPTPHQTVRGGPSGRPPVPALQTSAASPASENLPPLPAGLQLEQLAQFGSAGLEMAIRLGMQMGMQLSQGNAHHAQSTPGTEDATSLSTSLDPQSVQEQMARMLQATTASQISSPSPRSPSGPNAARYGSMTTLTAVNPPQTTNIVTDILNDDFFTAVQPSTTPGLTPGAASGFNTSRRTSQSGHESSLVSPHMPSPTASVLPDPSVGPDALAQKDPLAAQVWKAYARAKNTLPNGPRMENLTWRMMHMTLKKVDATPKPARGMGLVPEEPESLAIEDEERDVPSAMAAEEVERGRRGRFRGKGKVVGFDAESPQNRQER
jgi:GATA-binding protein